MKKILAIVFVLLCLGVNAFAAGDLIVNGKIGVGTNSLREAVEINGSIAVVLNGERYIVTILNGAEDTYVNGAFGQVADTCDGNITVLFNCTPTSVISSCVDNYFLTALNGYYHRTVTCALGAAGFLKQP
jgi:hypothetical protein